MTTSNDERAQRGVEHLQSAAIEMIAAARAFLDVVEDVVNDPDKVADVVSAVGSVATSARDAARDTRRGARRGASQRGSQREEGDLRDEVAGEPETDRVQRIPVS